MIISNSVMNRPTHDHVLSILESITPYDEDNHIIAEDIISLYDQTEMIQENDNDIVDVDIEIPKNLEVNNSTKKRLHDYLDKVMNLIDYSVIGNKKTERMRRNFNMARIFAVAALIALIPASFTITLSGLILPLLGAIIPWILIGVAVYYSNKYEKDMAKIIKQIRKHKVIIEKIRRNAIKAGSSSIEAKADAIYKQMEEIENRLMYDKGFSDGYIYS